MYTQVFALFWRRKQPTHSINRSGGAAFPPIRGIAEIRRAEFSANADCVSGHGGLGMGEGTWKASAFLSIEGAELLTSDAHVQRAYDAGVRMVSLSWNGYNPYACGAVF